MRKAVTQAAPVPIKTLEQANEFLKACVHNLRLNLDPDQDFEDIVEYRGRRANLPTFTRAEVRRLNTRMLEAHAAFDAAGADIYKATRDLLIEQETTTTK